MTMAQQLEARGMEKGLKKGFAEGMEKGMEKGLYEGISEGKILATINIYREEMGMSPEKVKFRIMDRYELTEEEAERYLRKA